MLVVAIACFAIAAIAGVVLAFLHLSQKNVPVGIAVLHGLLAVTGEILFLVGIGQGHTGRMLITALVLFLIAAVVGLALFTMHLRSRPLPIPLLLLHALVAGVAFLILIGGVLRYAV